MPNAKDAKPSRVGNILCFGQTGGGKTQQFATLPGKKFAYLFDSNAIDTLCGADIDYEEFMPSRLDLSLHSLKKSTAPGTKSKLKATKAYELWEQHFEASLDNGFFDQYNAIMLDSLTTFSDMIMDSVLAMNGRSGQWPQQDDYGPQMNAIMKIFRVLTSLGKTVYVTGHIELLKDEMSQRVFYQPLITGKLKTKLPLLFSQIFFLSAEVDNQKNVKYQLQTKPDRITPLIRCTLKNPVPKYKEDVTLDFSKPLESQGLGRILLNQNKE